MNKPNHLDGMRWCLELIQELREEYARLGLISGSLSIERVLCDVENVIGERCIKDWRRK